MLCLNCKVNTLVPRKDREVRFCSRKCCSDFHKGDFIIKKGYKRILLYGHPRSDGKGYVREHLLVMEKKLGRPVLFPEVVHHVDGNKLNNHPDNLMLFASNSEHIKYEALIKAKKI